MAGAVSRTGGQRRSVAAGGAAAVELQPVAIDLVLGGGGELLDQAVDGALVQVPNVAAGDAYEVVVVAAPAEAVAEGAVLQEDSAEDVQVGEEAHGAEDGGATNVSDLA